MTILNALTHQTYLTFNTDKTSHLGLTSSLHRGGADGTLASQTLGVAALNARCGCHIERSPANGTRAVDAGRVCPMWLVTPAACGLLLTTADCGRLPWLGLGLGLGLGLAWLGLAWLGLGLG